MLRIAYPDKDWETVIALGMSFFISCQFVLYLGFLIVKVADLSRTIILISLFTFMTFSFVVSGTQLEEGSSKKTQNHLMQIIKNIFPDNTTMYFNYQHPEMRLSATHRKLQVRRKRGRGENRIFFSSWTFLFPRCHWPLNIKEYTTTMTQVCCCHVAVIHFACRCLWWCYPSSANS